LRTQHDEALRPILAEVIKTKTVSGWIREITEIGVPLEIAGVTVDAPHKRFQVVTILMGKVQDSDLTETQASRILAFQRPFLPVKCPSPPPRAPGGTVVTVFLMIELKPLTP